MRTLVPAVIACGVGVRCNFAIGYGPCCFIRNWPSASGRRRDVEFASGQFTKSIDQCGYMVALFDIVRSCELNLPGAGCETNGLIDVANARMNIIIG